MNEMWVESDNFDRQKQIDVELNQILKSCKKFPVGRLYSFLTFSKNPNWSWLILFHDSTFENLL